MKRVALPPFDPPDGENQIHITLPPEQVIPPAFGPGEDPLWMRMNFGNMVIPGDYKWDGSGQNGLPSTGITMTSGPYKGLYVPFLVGANSTPPNAMMSGMTHLYPREVQDAILTEHAKANMRHFLVPGDVQEWNQVENGYIATAAKLVAWYDHLHDWGFRVVGWRGDPRDERIPIEALLGSIDWYIHGKEVDSIMTSEDYEASLRVIDAKVKGKIPIGVHFTAGAPPRSECYPLGFPRDTFLNNWSPYDGRVHLMLQMDPDDTAAHMSAMAYYARVHVNCGGGDGGSGPGAPHSRVVFFESRQTAELYGRCGVQWLSRYNNDLAITQNAYARLTSWENICATRNDPRVLPMSGFGDDCSYPNGDFI